MREKIGTTGHEPPILIDILPEVKLQWIESS